MPGITQYHTIPLPKGWPRRVRSAVIQAISLARVARRITRSGVRSWPSRHRLLSVDHYSRILYAGGGMRNRGYEIFSIRIDGKDLRQLPLAER